MKTVSVINFKGGVGKTTISFHLACHLAANAKVLLIDVDHQSSLSLVILSDDHWQAAIDRGHTTNAIFESFCRRNGSLPGSEIITKHAFSATRSWLYPNLDLVPAQFELDDTEIDLASTTFANPMESEWDKRTLLASWLDAIGAEAEYDYVIFDCPPATKIVSQNALAASDGYIIPVIPDELSSRGVTHFQNLVETKIDDKLKFLRGAARVSRPPAAYVEDTELAAIVPYLVKTAGAAASGMTNIHTEQLAALRRTWGAGVLRATGKNYIGIPEAMDAGVPIWNFGGVNARPRVKAMMRNICDELKTRIDAL